MRATDRHTGAHRTRLGAASALVVGLVALVAQLVTGAGSAASQTAAPASPTGTSGMTLVDQSAWVAPTGTFALEVDAGTVPADAQVVARIYVPISTQTQLQRVARGQGLGQRVESVTVPAAGVPRAADGSLMLSYPMVPADGVRGPDGFLLANPGVYPFSVAVVGPGDHILSQLLTQLVRLPAATAAGAAAARTGTSSSAAASSLAVAVVVPYGAPVSHRPDRAATLNPRTLDALGHESDALAQDPTVPVSVTPVPETVDTLAELDRTTGTHLVSDLRAALAHRSILSGSYVPVDDGAWVAHGLSGGYDAQLAAGSQALDQLGAGVTDGTAVLDPTTTANSLQRVVARGAGVVVVPSDQLAPTSVRSTAATDTPLTQWFDLAEADGGHVAGVSTDATLSSLLADADDPVLAAHQVLAALALVSLDHSGSQACVRQPGQPCRRGVALALPTDPTRDTAVLGALLAGLAAPTAGGSANPLVRPVPLATFTASVDPSSASDRTTTDGTDTLRHLAVRPVASLDSYPAHFQAVTRDISSFRTMAAGPGGKALDLANAWQQLALTSGSTQLSTTEAQAYLTDIDADLHAQVDQVTAQSQQTVTLTAASGKIPFSISNALDYPVRVQLDFQSPKLHFVEGNRQTVVIAAGQPAHLTIPVTVRASGAFPMQVTISSPDHRLAITHTRFDVRSTAISGIGLVLTVTAGLFLALWWIRNARGTRRRRSLVGSTHPALRPGAPDTPAPSTP